MDLKALLPILKMAFDSVGLPALQKEVELIPNAEVRALVLALLPVAKQWVDAELDKLAA